MPKEYEVDGTVYEFPDEYSDEQVHGILSKQGVIKAAETPGALAQMGTSIGNAASGLAKTGAAVALGPLGDTDFANSLGLTGPMGMVKGLYEAQADQARQAKERFQQGNYLGAAESGLGAAVPVLGPFIQNTAQKLTTPGQRVEGATDMALAALPFGAESRLGRAATSRIGEMLPKFGQINPTEALIQAIKPRAAKVNFKSSLERAVPEMKAAEADLGKPIQSVGDAIDAADLANAKNWSQFEQYLNKAADMGAVVDGTPIANARIASIPSKLKLENPAAYQREVATANQYRRILPVQDAQKLLAETNASLKSYYSKYPSERYAEQLSDPGAAADVATGDTLRQVLYDKLDQIAGANGIPAQLKQRYGAVKEVKRELMGRKNVADRQNPQSLGQQAGSMYAGKEALDAAEKALTGRPLSAAYDLIKGASVKGIANRMRVANSSDALIEKAFAQYQPTNYGNLTGASLMPLPPPMPPAPAGLLEAGPIRMPGMPDASGPIPPKVPRGERVYTGPERQLPSPTIKMPGRAPELNNSGRDVTGERGAAPQIQQRMMVSPDQVAKIAQENGVTFEQAAIQLHNAGYRMWTPSFPINLNTPPMPPQ